MKVYVITYEPMWSDEPPEIVKVVDSEEKVKEYCKEKNYKTIELDGVRAEFNDGWALVRASNTGPNITARFEAKTNERAKEIQNEFETLVNTLIEQN